MLPKKPKPETKRRKSQVGQTEARGPPSATLIWSRAFAWPYCRKHFQSKYSWGAASFWRPCTKLVFTVIRFRPGHILVDYAMKDTADWFKIIVSKLLGWKGTELSPCAGDDISGVHMVTVYHPKAAALEMEYLIGLLIAQNEDLPL